MSDDFLGGDFPPTFKFENPGDKVSGIVVNVTKRDDTDPNGNVKTWASGETRKVYPFIIDSEQVGMCTAWVRGYMQKAAKTAAREAGIKQIAGNHITIEFTGCGQSKTKGFAPPKMFKVTFKPAPASSISADDLLAS